jgi:hypothetical protein
LSKANNHGTRLDLRYEWFCPRGFIPGAATYKVQTNILVLWLSESFFEDDPLVRLPLLLYSLRLTNALNDANCAAVKLIGPVHSYTLQQMLPGQFPATKGYGEQRPSQRAEVTTLLSHIEIFCATPSAMDEVLVSDITEIPRATVRTNLLKAGFKSFHNFTVTDAQLAEEACAELELRRASLTNTNNHLVLIAEWDTFYARMVSLTYRAKLAVLQEKGEPLTLQKYLKDYRNGNRPSPTNFHSYYYLRGLDGQTVVSDTPASNKPDRTDASKPRLASVDAFRQWEADANKAEGPSQLDYLARLGDLLQELEVNLRHNHGGQIKAIGIVGSDVYDTLIILQALRSRFPDALFFTTDLDARFWHPKEMKWARNLIVLSGYGLALDSQLQRGVSPFRGSGQTAQFAATLAALGDTNLVDLATAPARRFEIGKHGAIDLSVLPGVLTSNNLVSSAPGGFRLHPFTRSESYRQRHYLSACVRWSIGILVIAIVALVLFCKPVTRATWGWSTFLCESLEYTEEDFGGPDGAAVLLRQMNRSSDEFLRWICAELDAEFQRVSDSNFLKHLKKAEDDKPVSQEGALELEEMHEKLAYALAATFNRILKHETKAKPHDDHIRNTSAVQEDIHNQAKFLSLSSEWKATTLWGRLTKHRKRLEIYEASREFLDKLLKNLPNEDDLAEALHPPFRLPASEQDRHECEAAEKAAARKLKDAALEAAAAAREAAVEIVELRKKRKKCVSPVLYLAAVVGIGLGVSMWWDTLYSTSGQALSFGNGSSAWPAQILRFTAAIVAMCSCIAVYYKKRIAFAIITRRFRFTREPLGEVPAGRICAMESWLDYTRRRGWRKRFEDIFLPFGLYFLLCISIFEWSGGTMPFSPIRGHLVECWNIWLLMVAVVSFLYLTFVTIDTALRCRSFILKLGAAPTDYPESTRRHFARVNGNLDEAYLDEWIDIQLIAELTEYIGGMVYYPFFVFGLLLIARNESWAQWSWPVYLVSIFGFNLLLAVASVLILQLAAGQTKSLALANLKAKVKRLQNLAAPSKIESDSTQAERLLDEIRQIRRGAFAKTWESPLFGAMLVPSGGLTIVQGLIWVLSR